MGGFGGNQMIYIIAGMYRTGTSSLMHACLTASETLVGYYSLEAEQIIRSKEVDETHNPNPNGYYPPYFPLIPFSEWLPLVPENGITKATVANLLTIESMPPCKMIVTKRNTQEMILSWEKSFGTPFPEKQISEYEVGLALAAGDPNVEITTVSFDDLVSTPETVFTDLAAAGWPIDPAIAASTIDPDLKRF
jgi:hypothetical protein